MGTTPDHEAPGSPMPQAPEQHDDDQVGIRAQFTTAVASKGYIEILFQPSGERDVPAPPELGDRAGDVGEVEVHRQLVTEEPSQPHGDQRIAGKVCKNLEGKCIQHEEERHARLTHEFRIMKPCRGLPQIISHHHLEEKPKDEFPHSVIPVDRCQGLDSDLMHELMRLDDGPSD